MYTHNILCFNNFFRILEHYNNAKNESDHVFLRVDHNRDGLVSWLEYKAQLFGIDPSSIKNDNGTSM